MLAKEYGWTKNEILSEMYPDEVEFYVKRIRKDEANDRLTDLAIAHNPNSQNPNKLIEKFKKSIREVDGKDYITKDKMNEEDENQLKEIAHQMKTNAAKRG